MEHIVDVKGAAKCIGVPVEVYVENLDDIHVASGLYSILKGKWIVVPKKKELQEKKMKLCEWIENWQ